MGIKRNIAWAAFAAISGVSASFAAAAPAQEPLIITPAPEPGAGLVASSNQLLTVVHTRSAADEQPTFEQAMQSVSSALDRAIRAEQQTMEAACKASVRPKPGSAEVYAWGARCSYDRR